MLLALMETLNRQGKYRCLYVNIEAAQAAREDVDTAMRTILGELSSRARDYLDDLYPSTDYANGSGDAWRHWRAQ